MSLQFDTDIQFVKGIGPKLGDLFRRNGISCVRDLLERYPRAYEDRRAVRDIRSLVAGQSVCLRARIEKIRSIPLGRSFRRLWEVVLKDGSGKITCRFFRIPFKGYFERFEPFQEVRVTGKVTLYRGVLSFTHPDLHPVPVCADSVKGSCADKVKDRGEEAAETTAKDEDELVPIYSEFEGFSSARQARLIAMILGQSVPETLPRWLIEKHGLVGLSQALHEIHRPPVEQGDLFMALKAPAQQRLIFDELFLIELYFAVQRAGLEREKSAPIVAKANWSERLRRGLPFNLTLAQERAVSEIVADLGRPFPMHRLIQGDVGCGKTVVAFLASALAADAGFQCALMVPTEALAEQHYKNAMKFVQGLDFNVALLTGQVTGHDRDSILDSLKSGKTSLCIGTQALIQESVEFHRLGLVVIDEQHRFGVEQRQSLKGKGLSPHFLVMTATPIPRSLAMTVFGDLDVSIVDEFPAGRQVVVTRKATQGKRGLVFGFVREQLRKGRQAYFVYPLVRESERVDVKNAVEEFERVRIEFSEFKVGLLHGRMKAKDKTEVMDAFREGRIQLLVTTTVIEVGVDVANANIMVIEHAERFGLSQLHQLRGRVGRGAFRSFCVLCLGEGASDEAVSRVEILEQTNDGFKIAEADLEIRGPGELIGLRQNGQFGFKLGNLVRDQAILATAREAAWELLRRDPDLSDAENQWLKRSLEKLAKNWVG